MKRKPHPDQPRLESLVRHEASAPAPPAPPAVPRCKDVPNHTHWAWRFGSTRWTLGSAVCDQTPNWCDKCDMAFDVGCRCVEWPAPPELPPLRPCIEPDCGMYARAGSEGCVLHAPKEQQEEEEQATEEAG